MRCCVMGGGRSAVAALDLVGFDSRRITIGDHDEKAGEEVVARSGDERVDFENHYWIGPHRL